MNESRTIMLLLDCSAVIYSWGNYPYVLTRRVGPENQAATFTSLGPSTADTRNDDPEDAGVWRTPGTERRRQYR